MNQLILVDALTKYDLIHTTHIIPFMGIGEIVELEYKGNEVLENGEISDIPYNSKYKNMKFLCNKFPQNKIYEVLDVLNNESNVITRRKAISPFPYVEIYDKDNVPKISEYTNLLLIKDLTRYLYIPIESMLFHVKIDVNKISQNPLVYSIQNKITPIDNFIYPFDIGKIYACIYTSDHFSPLFETHNLHSKKEIDKRTSIIQDPIKIEIIIKIFKMKINSL